MDVFTMYAIEDLVILNNMVDANEDNPNLVYPLKTWIDDSGISRLYANEDLLKASIESVLRRFMDFLTPTNKYKTDYFESELLFQIIFEDELDKMPLYINEPNSLGIIAKWRLKIGK